MPVHRVRTMEHVWTRLPVISASVPCSTTKVYTAKQVRHTQIYQAFSLHLHLSRSLVDRWGATDDLATSSLHSSRLSALVMAAPNVMPVHSGMLSSHLFSCLPLLLPPGTVPCRIVLASPVDLVTCPYHFSLRRFTLVKRSSWGPMACRVLVRTSSLEMWSL